MPDHHPIHAVAPFRRPSISAKSKYTLYKVELRTDFSKKCGYCDTSDYYSGGQRGFHIDHFAPKKKFSHLVNEYQNLVYSCPICNTAKSDDWPGDDPNVSHVSDKGYIDPCSSSYKDHLARNKSGQIIPLTPLGGYIHKKLKLNLKRRQICWLVDKMETQMRALDEIISKDPENLAQLQAFHKLGKQYIAYIGILKSE